MNKIINLIEQKALFLGASKEFEKCEKVIVGLPMDATTSFRPGTRLAPYRVREVSEGIEEYSVYLDKSLEEINYYDVGDLIIPFGNIAESLNRMELVTEELLNLGKKVYAIGGEHLVTLALIKAYTQFYNNLVVIQFDAHADLREDYLGESMSHATVMRKIVDLIPEKNLYQLGIRSGTKEEFEYARENTNLYLDTLPNVDELKAKIGNKPVYITVDIDFLDPAFAPGTGTPEAAGFTSRELLQILRDLNCLNIVGFDLVEISPPFEKGDNTSILGAKILREALLAY
ncbi:Agmatinase [Candidatus Syntrophocurvum alkaliphilum]|uniref:Agmatinase n=1 Tax=Candidatus Syntrophocurvum alkaliphilum TaxID=2293317 RepID=A0A6I6DEX5_9FIRM|nr:agmatinase [Candidatus Syntrophocurvum alkaliphilum]QGT99031.1 Agmatinase [Candidatus Syntrophocurvum alkaliphilum]